MSSVTCVFGKCLCLVHPVFKMIKHNYYILGMGSGCVAPGKEHPGGSSATGTAGGRETTQLRAGDGAVPLDRADLDRALRVLRAPDCVSLCHISLCYMFECVYIYISLSIYIYTHTYVYIYICLCVYMYTYIHICMYVCMYVCMCVYIYIYIYTFLMRWLSSRTTCLPAGSVHLFVIIVYLYYSIRYDYILYDYILYYIIPYYIYIYIHMYICIYRCIYIYIHIQVCVHVLYVSSLLLLLRHYRMCCCYCYYCYHG